MVGRADGAIATVAGGREVADETVQAMTRVSPMAVAALTPPDDDWQAF